MQEPLVPQPPHHIGCTAAFAVTVQSVLAAPGTGAANAHMPEDAAAEPVPPAHFEQRTETGSSQHHIAMQFIRLPQGHILSMPIVIVQHLVTWELCRSCWGGADGDCARDLCMGPLRTPISSLPQQLQQGLPGYYVLQHHQGPSSKYGPVAAECTAWHVLVVVVIFLKGGRRWAGP